MQPLEGIVVVSLEQAVAAPLATRHLADLGARVIKVERPDGGDFARAYDSGVRGMASHFVWLNRGKESLTLDVKRPEGREVLARIAATADVFLQNLAPGSTERLGFDAATLTAEHPRLVVCDMSGYGPSGPYRDKRAYDLLVQSETALASVTGTADQPAKTGVPAADIGAGLYAFSSVLAALFRRERTGEGAVLEISMFDALTEWMGHPLYLTQHTGTAPPRVGLSHPIIAPYDAFPTGDGEQVVLGIQNDREWVRLATKVLERPELATDPDFATNQARVRNRERVNAAVVEGLARLTREEAVARLEEANIANARLRSVPQLVEHPQLTGRDRWREVDSPAGRLPTVLPPMNFADLEPPLGPVPDLGEHTEPILRSFGYSDEDITRLRTDQVV